MWTLAALLTGYILDLIFGDPHGSPLPHPVVLMGGLISLLEKLLRRLFPKTTRGEFWAGVVLAVCLPLIALGVPLGVLLALRLWHPAAAYVVESLWCYQVLATKCLRDESMAVHRALTQHDMPGARFAVSMIVGRDTDALDEAGVARAAVETVAENTGDGVIAPMLFMAIGGAPLGMLYKAINTMDSMVGYKNERYLYFGRAAARLDDAANYLPSRIAALLMVAAAALCGQDAPNAWRIWRRDRRNHTSPNSAQTEAVCAGALGLELGGPSLYKGVMVPKPTIGDALRPIETRDIARANRLMYATSLLSLAVCLGIRAGIVLVFL